MTRGSASTRKTRLRVVVGVVVGVGGVFVVLAKGRGRGREETPGELAEWLERGLKWEADDLLPATKDLFIEDMC